MTETILTNVRIWDGISDDIDEGMDAIAFADGNITFVGAAADAPAGASADMGGVTLVPGLIDAHVHLCLDPEERDPLAHGKKPKDQQLAEMRERAAGMLKAGITTARDLGGGQWLELQVRDEIERGEFQGVRLICSGQPITTEGGHCHFWGGEASDTDTALEVLERQSDHGVDLIKVMATGGNITPGSKPVDAQFDEDVIAAVVHRATELGFHVAAHCHGTAGIGNAARAGVRTIEHCSWVGSDGWGKAYDEDIVSVMVEGNTFVSPTINSGWKRFRGNDSFVAMIHKNYEKMKAAGVQLIASTDAGIPNVFHHRLPEAIPQFAFFAGLTNVQALRSATSICASAIGLGEKVGQLKSGYSADFLVIDGDPLADLELLTDPGLVYARGRKVS